MAPSMGRGPSLDDGTELAILTDITPLSELNFPPRRCQMVHHENREPLLERAVVDVKFALYLQPGSFPNAGQNCR